MSERTVKVVCGANSETVTPGMKVADVRRELAEALNIAPDARAMVSGDNVENEYELRDGDTLEFIKQSGVKG